MISFTPGSAAMREESTRPSLTTRPTAVRCAPGIGRAWDPSSSIVFTTRCTWSCVAPCSITISISTSYGENVAVIGCRHLAGELPARDRGWVGAFDLGIEMGQHQPPGAGRPSECAGLRGGQMYTDALS